MTDSRNGTQRCDNTRSKEIHWISSEELKKALNWEWDRISPEYVKKTVRILSRLSKINYSKRGLQTRFKNIWSYGRLSFICEELYNFHCEIECFHFLFIVSVNPSNIIFCLLKYFGWRDICNENPRKANLLGFNLPEVYCLCSNVHRINLTLIQCLCCSVDEPQQDVSP